VLLEQSIYIGPLNTHVTPIL